MPGGKCDNGGNRCIEPTKKAVTKEISFETAFPVISKP